MTRNFPTLSEVLAIHEMLIKAFGGIPGVRDLGALEAALMRPQLGYYSGILEEAAAMMESLANNHAFLDGNKRVAFFATDTFLRMNQHYVDCDNEAANDHFMHLFETQRFEYAALLDWLMLHVKPL